MIEQISGWLVLMILTGIMTAKLLGVIDRSSCRGFGMRWRATFS